MNEETTTDDKAVDLGALRAKLAGKSGADYWRSLDELARTDDFNEYLASEFPAAAEVDAVGRRDFLKVMGASMAFAGLAGCTRQPVEKIVPYVRAPEDIIPGKPLYFASAASIGGYGRGVLVESHMGRPTKIEGNPEHPDSLGATDAQTQASVLDLYDPDRSQTVLKRKRIASWSEFVGALSVQAQAQKLTNGARLRILTGAVTSPTMVDQLQRLLTEFPAAKWHQYEAVARDNVYEGARLAFGEPYETQYRLDAADRIVALESDFLFAGPGCVRYARDFAKRRDPDGEMNRFYVVESTPSVTGTMADHRLSLAPSAVAAFAVELARALGVNPGLPPGGLSADQQQKVEAVTRDLQAHRGRGLVVVGEQQPAYVHALAHAINDALGNAGKTVVYTDPIEADPGSKFASLQDLTRDMADGAVDALIILGANPVYTAPVDLDFAKHLEKVSFRAHLGTHEDETAELCHWHVPEAHYLESWSDVRAYDGTVSIVQPLIEPLYGGRSAHEALAVLLGEPGEQAYDIVRAYWQTKHKGGDFERFWRTSLHDGVVAGTAFAARQPRLRLVAKGFSPPVAKGLELVFRADPSVWDGRFANNGWLQELAKPLTKLTWDNALMMSPATAEKQGLKQDEVVELKAGNHAMQVAVWVLPGQPADVLTVHLGYGRPKSGRIGTAIGFNANAIRSSEAPWIVADVKLRKTGGVYPLVTTQHHHSMEGRNLVRTGSAHHYHEHPHFVQHMEHHSEENLSMYADFKYEGYAWGMAVNLNTCNGCNACIMACQAENNITVVGKDQVSKGREMAWLRVDRYYKGDDIDEPEEIVSQPVPCMQCEQAPCEPVCPVGATTHSDEGLNDMVYNRCVGTRYCSNNCPYKVRRFNYLAYTDHTTETLKLQRNPDVTVRMRGVMEKCTYCVQRINLARIDGKKENRKLRDGEIKTACQQACPSDAIVFGDINDPDSRVSQLKAHNLNYALLGELGTRPRTTYLARLRNPNPELEA